MDDDVAIKVEHISKKFCKSLMRSMWYGIKDIARNTIGLRSHSERLRKGEFWAVNDISFELKKGESLGLVGPNGSGKTTILKMLNGIFWPDTGKITVRGRVGALIEVGAGFHPNLTGKENIYINGAILGMKKEEIDEKYDEIVEFAGIGDFINSPVKYYSSGMYIRLGFAVAVHGEQDILLVDEVLAVGDSAFASKCYQKMFDIRNTRDVAIILVSHNLNTVERFCDRGIFLNEGKIVTLGDVHKAIKDYQTMIYKILEKEKEKEEDGVIPGIPHRTKEAEILKVKYLDKNRKEKNAFSPGEKVGIRVKYKANKIIKNPIFNIHVFNPDGIHLLFYGTDLDEIKIESISGEGVIECWIEKLPLLWNKYYLIVAIYDEFHNITYDFKNYSYFNRYFQVLPNKTSVLMDNWTPAIDSKCEWKIVEEDSNFESETE